MQRKLNIILNSRPEKSVKRAIHINCNAQLKETGQYHIAAIKALTRLIKNPNILSEILILDICKAEFRESSIKKFLYFLLIKYSEKQILNLFTSIDEKTKNRDIFSDLIINVSTIENHSQFFMSNIDLKCNLSSLHDKVYQYITEIKKQTISDKKINNSENILYNCMQIEEYDVRVPHTGKELYQWSQAMRNCLASYLDKIVTKKSNIYCFFKNNEIDFAVEMHDGCLYQSYAKYNKELNSKQAEILEIWHGKVCKKLGMIPVSIVYDRKIIG